MISSLSAVSETLIQRADSLKLFLQGVQQAALSPAVSPKTLRGKSSSSKMATSTLSSPKVHPFLTYQFDSDKNINASVIPFYWISLLGSQYSWNYTTVPQPQLNNRSIAFAGGNLLGGGSSISTYSINRSSSRY
jgi:choline dehydrogenase-like flavoprotein